MPVQNGTVTENNFEYAYVFVGYPVKAFVLQSAGIYFADVIANGEVLNS